MEKKWFSITLSLFKASNLSFQILIEEDKLIKDECLMPYYNDIKPFIEIFEIVSEKEKRLKVDLAIKIAEERTERLKFLHLIYD